MKWNCELIQDLLPLYAEGLCSGASTRAVEDHLCECDACRRLAAPLPIPEPEEAPAEDRTLTRTFRRIRRRWLASVLAAVLIVPLLLMSVNQVRGHGLCFTNLDDLLTARRFLGALERQDWETAAALHDYSGDYESILESLNTPLEDYAPQFTPISLAGKDYMLRSDLSPGELEGEAPAALFRFLYNRVGFAMIPADLWQQVIAVDPSAIQQSGLQYWLSGEPYGQITTPWGEFVISGGVRYATAAEYAHRLSLIPAQVYEEAKPVLEAEARQVYNSTHAAYDYVAQMTETEFITHMQESYAADLAACGAEFDCTGYRSSYLSSGNDGWHISFGVTITYCGKNLDTTAAISVENGKIHIVSLSHLERADWLHELENALYPSAHPDY